jgi:hypothetical protein
MVKSIVTTHPPHHTAPETTVVFAKVVGVAYVGVVVVSIILVICTIISQWNNMPHVPHTNLSNIVVDHVIPLLWVSPHESAYLHELDRLGMGRVRGKVLHESHYQPRVDRLCSVIELAHIIVVVFKEDRFLHVFLNAFKSGIYIYSVIEVDFRNRAISIFIIHYILI